MKKILITGSRSGIALSLINKLIKKNYYIYATTRTEKQALRLKEIYKNYNNINCFKLDICNENDRNKINDLDIDVLICDAAISNGGSLTEINIDKVKENYDINIFCNLELIQLYIKNIINKKGKIIIMSSLAGIIPLNFIGTYSSTKASLIKIAETLKNELKLINKNIKICLIEPGMYKTGFNEYMFENKYGDYNSYFDDIINKIKLKENLMIKFLCRKNLNSIVKKIKQAIENDSDKFIYRAPLFQVVGAKIYSIFKQ